MPHPVFRPLALAGFGLLTLPVLADEPVELDTLHITSERAAGEAEEQKGYRVSRTASATRTDTDLREVPQAVSAIPASVLQDLGSHDVQRALEFAGGVAKQNNFGGLTLYEYSIRGFTTSEFYKDGFSANRGYPSSPDAANVERIDVLKGPSASVYGRGDPGGTVNIVTKRPEAEPFARLQASAGSWDRYRTTLDVNAPLDEQQNLLGRLNLAVQDDNSFRDHVEARRFFAAPSLSWQLSPATSLLLQAEIMRHASTFDRGVVAPNNALGGVSRSAFYGEPNDGLIHNDNNQLQGELRHELNERWALRLASHYKQGSLDGHASESRALAADGRTLSRRYRERDMAWHDSITQAELDGLVSFAGFEHQLLLGSEYERYGKHERVTAIAGPYAIDLYHPVYGQPKPTGARSGTDFYEQVQSRALYLQDQIALTEKLRVVLGARYEHFDQDIQDHTGGAGSRQRDDVFTERAGLLYQLTPELGLFTNISTSFKPNSGLDAAGKGFKPEEGLGYEAGVKAALLDQRIDATLTAFYIEKENVLALDPATDTNRAVGKARSQGVDLQLVGQVTDAVRVIGAWAYIDAKVTQGDRSIPAGSRILGVARNSASLLGVYEFQEGLLRGSDVGAAWTYVGNRSGQAGGSFVLPAYRTVDLLAHYKASDTLSFGVNLNNLFDEKYDERSYSNDWVTPGDPRNLTLSMNVAL